MELPERYPSGREFWRLARVGELEEVVPRGDQVRRFGIGERESINVALENREWVLLWDDHRAYRMAASLGLHVLCTPLLVIDLVRDGEIDAEEASRIEGELERMKTVSPDLIAIARTLLAAMSGEHR